MRVGVHRQADLTMAELFHYSAHTGALSKQQRGGAVSQMVPVNAREPGRAERVLKHTRYVPVIEDRLHGCAEETGQPPAEAQRASPRW